MSEKMTLFKIIGTHMGVHGCFTRREDLLVFLRGCVREMAGD